MYVIQKIAMSNFWRAVNQSDLANRERSDGGGRSTSTTKRDMSDNEVEKPRKTSRCDGPSITEGKKVQKKQFLKKGSRKFLACSGPQAPTCKDKENGTSVHKKPARKSRDTKTRQFDQTDLQQGEATPHSRCPIKIQQSADIPLNKCIPPQLLISRLSGKLISEKETPSVVRKVYSDGRISMSYKDANITEEYLANMVLTSWSHGDWKLQWQNRVIYRMENLNVWEIDGQIV